MLPESLFQVLTVVTDCVILLAVGFYFFRLVNKEKEIEQKENKIDTNYHQIVDNALSKERKILEDATAEAGHIISDAKYVNTNSKQTVDQALQKMIGDIQNQTAGAAGDFRKSYGSSLQQLSTQSLNDFQSLSKQMQADLQVQLKKFHDTLLPNMEKELQDYKQARLKETEQTITKVIQQASQEILGKSMSYEDHQRLMLDAMEKAKKEGLFN